MADLITPQGGYTQQGQGVQNLMDTLGATAATMQSQQGTFEGQTQSRLAQEAGIPELSQGAADLGKIFQLYLADSNLAQKYAAPTQQSSPPTAQGYQALADNPSQATLPDNSQGFTGFTTPSINTRAMMTTPNAVQSALENLMGALSTQRTNVKDYTGMASKNYQGTIEALLGLSDRLYQQKKDKEDRANKALHREIVDLNGKKVLIDTDTGDIIKEYGVDVGEGSEYLDDKKRIISEITGRLIPNTNYATVGVGGVTAGLPMSPAKDYASDLNTLRSNLSLSELTRLRMSSKTGGGVGQVSNYEQMLLQNSVSGISDQTISPEKMKQNLQYIKDYAEGKNLKKYTGVDSASANATGKTSGRFIITKVE